jgi:hypothetical protein
MSVDTIGSLAPFQTDRDPAPLTRSRRRTPSTPAWLLRITVESFFIVLSILAAFAVENWRDNQNNQRLAVKSLQIFEREINQNLAAIEDLAPFHSGILNILAQARADTTQMVDVRSVMEGLQVIPLRNAAWQTALGTGVLTHIDVETVWGLSLTYSRQQRFVEELRAALPSAADLQAGSRDETQKAIQAAFVYMNELVKGEQDLRGYYNEVLQTITRTLEDQTRFIDNPNVSAKK